MKTRKREGRKRLKVCLYAHSGTDWGGASRSMFTMLNMIDTGQVDITLVIDQPGPDSDKLKAQHGIRVISDAPLIEPKSRWYYIVSFLKSLKWLYREKFDLIHVNHANYWKPAQLLAAKFLRIPIITHYRTKNTAPSPWVAYSKGIICTSEYIRENSDSLGVKKYVVYNCVNDKVPDQSTNNTKQLALRNKDIVVCYVAQIREKKGIKTYLEIARMLQNKPVTFIICGSFCSQGVAADALEEEQFMQQISELNNVRYLGYIKSIEEIFQASDILINPTQLDEAFCRVNIEAGLAGNAVISSNRGAITETVEEGETAYCFDPLDIDGITKKLTELISSPEKIRLIGERAKIVYTKKYVSQPLKSLIKVYQDVSA